MAKSSKVEDYWRQNNVENLFKELTQLLVRRTPADPAIAIVEYLQKKFPKSFKTSANNLQRQSITSIHSDVQNESMSDVQIERPSSNLSQTSAIATIPTVGSAFTDLFKQDTSSTKQVPDFNIRNLVFANRIGQQAVKMGKDIRSDHDILEEEIIKPIKINAYPSRTDNTSTNFVSDDLQNAQSYEEPSVPQLIKYKQQIHQENDRRLHQEKLAELAKNQRKKEEFFQSDLSLKPEEIQQQKLVDGNETLSQVVLDKTTTSTNLSHKPIVKSQEEEEILNDENVFKPRHNQYRERSRNKLSTPRPNTSYIPRQTMSDFQLLMKKPNENMVCKVCGHSINGGDNQPIVDCQQGSTHGFQAQSSNRSVETSSGAIDDWFESESTPRPPDDAIPSPNGSTTFRRSLFQPINDNNDDIVEHRPPIRPLIRSDDDETKTKRLLTPRMSESGYFIRSPEPKVHRPSSSPVTKTDPLAVTSPQLGKTLSQTTPPTMNSTGGRRTSGSSVRDNSPDGSGEN